MITANAGTDSAMAVVTEALEDVAAGQMTVVAHDGPAARLRGRAREGCREELHAHRRVSEAEDGTAAVRCTEEMVQIHGATAE